MRTYTLLLLGLLASQAVTAGEPRSVLSPPHRTAMLELYTSEGCSSCPPADRWLSSLRRSGVSERRLIPMAFHVTYWDYIGWKDRFGDEQYDQRQRLLGRANSLSTVYTPQFVLDGRDFRRYRSFTDEVSAINEDKSEVDLKLSLEQRQTGDYDIELEADTARAELADVALFVAVVESGLSTEVAGGENEGETLHHDYVVRELEGPVFVSRPAESGTLMHSFELDRDWKAADMDVVGFAQNLRTGKVLQAVSMPLLQRQSLSDGRD